MLHIARLIDRRFGTGEGTLTRGLLVLSALTLGAGMLLLAWR